MLYVLDYYGKPFLAVVFLLFCWMAWRKIRPPVQLPDITRVDGMDGGEFEDFCVALLKANGYVATRIGKSGDHGGDVLAKKGGKKYAIQCKCYSRNVGCKAVREANGAVEYYHCHYAVVMTNRRLTKGAVDEVRHCDVKIWDRGELIRMIESAKRRTRRRGKW